MSMSDTNQARRYASIAEVAAAQAKISADKLDGAPAYAEQAAASASAAANSAQAAISAEIVVNGIAAQANQSAISAAESAAEAGSAASSAIGRTIRVPDGELLSDLPAASSRVNAVPVFDANSNIDVKNLSDFAIIDSGTGKLPVSIVPSVALTVPFVVSNQEEMLALPAQVGDVAKRTDLGYSFMLGADPASTLSNWVQLTDNVLTQLSQSSGASMIGAKDDEDNPTTVQQLLDAKASTASLSANSGATTIGATNLSGGGVTVQQSLTSLNQSIAALTAKDGFNLVGRFLNLSELRAKAPEAAGQIVYVASAASATATEKHYGGGYFQSFDNSTSPIADDGGIVIVPATGTLAWRRINFTEYDAHFWGVKADDVTDNADAIERAMNFARSEKVVIEFPEGNILTSRPIPIYSYTGIRGKGRADTTVFQKTTNTPFEYKNGNTVVYTVNCLVAFIPETWDRASPNMSSFCHTGRLENARFIRQGLQVANISDAPAVGVFLAKAASPVLRNINIEGGVIGLQAFVTFSGVWEMVGITQWNTYGFAGVLIQDFRDGILHNAGTSMSMNLVQVRGYQFGFQIARLQYTTMINCTVEEGYPQVGNAERKVYAYDYTDPFSVTMSGCATEFIAGGQIRVLPFTNPSFRPTLNVEGYIPIDQQNPEVSTPMFYVDSGGSIPMYVVFMGCELSRDTTKPNNAAPIVSGTNAKVIVTGCHGENWTTSSGGVFTRLA